MKKSIIILVFIAIITGSFKFQQIEIKGNFKYFTTDNIGNIFAVTDKNDIVKFNKFGVKKAEINIKVLGDVTSIDAVNPFEIYVFYRDYGKLMYFDNNLNNLGETDLLKTLGLNNIQVVCRSFDNGFWFVDPENLKLKKCDKKGNLLSESVNISTLTDTIISPQSLTDDGKFVYLKSGNNKLMKFDVLANYINTFSLPAFSTFQVKDENILLKTNDSYLVFNTSTLETFKFKYQFENNYLNIRNEGKILFLHDSTGIKLVELKD